MLELMRRLCSVIRGSRERGGGHVRDVEQFAFGRDEQEMFDGTPDGEKICSGKAFSKAKGRDHERRETYIIPSLWALI